MSVAGFRIASFDVGTPYYAENAIQTIKLIHSRWIWNNLSIETRSDWSPEKYKLRKSTEDSIANEDWEYRFSEVMASMAFILNPKIVIQI